MTYKSKKNWKDLVEGPSHQTLTRRDLLAHGLATGLLSVALPKLVAGEFIRNAHADSLACPPPTRNVGALAQIYAEGGPTMGARFIGEAQASMMNQNMANNYGISGQANLVKLGPNLVIDKTSPFGFTLLQGPNGYPGGAAAWKTNVLNKISGGGHLGPFNADDGAGSDSGLLGGVSPFKTSQLGKDLRVNVRNTVAGWANGLPSVSSSGKLTPTSFASKFGLTPAANGLINAQVMTGASDAANSLARALASVMGTDKRKASSQLMTNAGCAFYGNSSLADPAFGASLFDPTKITALNGKVALNALSAQEQALIAAYYQAAAGVAGGVITQFGGRDYHGADPQNTIAPADIEEARSIVMFLAACEAAQARGAMIYLSNGQAIASGVQAVNVNVGGTNSNMNAPVAQGDAGGAYNAGLILFYDPKGAPPQAKFTGTVDSSSGNAKIDPKVASSKDAVAGLYLSGLAWINNGTLPDKAVKAMQASGAASVTANVVVI